MTSQTNISVNVLSIKYPAIFAYHLTEDILKKLKRNGAVIHEYFDVVKGDFISENLFHVTYSEVALSILRENKIDFYIIPAANKMNIARKEL